MFTKEQCTHQIGTLLVAGKIVSGAIFNGTTFVAGNWEGWNTDAPHFDVTRMHPIRGMERLGAPWTFDITGREIDIVGDGRWQQAVVRVTRAEALA